MCVRAYMGAYFKRKAWRSNLVLSEEFISESISARQSFFDFFHYACLVKSKVKKHEQQQEKNGLIETD